MSKFMTRTAIQDSGTHPGMVVGVTLAGARWREKRKEKSGKRIAGEEEAVFVPLS
jgi:hypothetical protein